MPKAKAPFKASPKPHVHHSVKPVEPQPKPQPKPPPPPSGNHEVPPELLLKVKSAFFILEHTGMVGTEAYNILKGIIQDYAS